MLRIRTLALGALLAAAPAAPAQAAGDPVYDVTFDVRVQHEAHSFSTVPGGSQALDLEADTHLTGTFGQVAMGDGNARTVGYTTADTTATTTGTFSSVETWLPPRAITIRRQCALAPEPIAMGPVLDPDVLSGLGGTVPVNVRFAAKLIYAPDFDSGTCPASAPPAVIATKAVGDDVLDEVIVLPKEAVGMGKTIELVRGSATGAACPGADWPGETTCTLTWEGEVTFTRVGTDEAPPTPPQIEPTPEPTPDPTDEELLAPLVTSAKVSKRGDRLKVTARCPGGCRGSAKVGVRGGRGAHAARTRAVRLPLRLAAAPQAQTVTVRVPRRLRAPLRRAGRATVLVTLRGDTGPRATVTRRLVVRR